MADVQRALRSWWVVGGTAVASISDGVPGTIYPLTNPVAGFSYQYTLVGSKSDLFCVKMKKNHIQPMTNQNLSLVPDPSLLPTHCAKMRQQVLLLLTKRSPRVKWPRPPLFRQVQLTLTVVAPGHFIITWHNRLKIHQRIVRTPHTSSLIFFYFQMEKLERCTIWGVKDKKK